MIKDRVIKSLISVGISTCVLLIIGAIIWWFVRESQTVLADILFYVGAAAIALFSIGLLGDFFGRGDISYQLSRSVLKQASNQRALQDENDNKSRTSTGLNWIGAGLLLWLISYFL